MKDSDNIRLDSQHYLHAVNATIENFDGNTPSLQNDYSNLLGTTLNEDIVGFLFIAEKNTTLVFTPSSIVLVKDKVFSDAYLENTRLETITQSPILDFTVLVNSACFKFSKEHLLKIKYKITDCTLNLYFSDGHNPDKHITFDYDSNFNLTVTKDYLISTQDNCDTIYSDVVDCNKILFYPEISYPCITVQDDISGNLIAGVYEIFTCYATSKGTPLTSYLSNSNPFSIFSKTLIGQEDYNTNKGFTISITDLSTTYKFLNVVVGETINNFTTYKLIAVLPVTGSTAKTAYTGNELVQGLSEQDLFQRYPYYETSNDIEVGNNYLFKLGLKEFDKFNIQRIANQIQLEAITIRVSKDFYKDPKNVVNNKSYLRDEIYSFGFELILDNGEITGVGHIPGRIATVEDLSPANITLDNNQVTPNWKVYNTAKLTSSPHLDTLWETFDFAYTESESDTYPLNKNIWGDLCGKKVRHHKFPDNSLSHIHDGLNNPVSNSYNKTDYLFPMGVRIKNSADIVSILDKAVVDNIITQEQRSRIRGYRLVRGNRANNKTIVAKGLLYDVWSYEKPITQTDTDCAKTQTYYYPNYPFNDLRDDVLLSANNKHYDYAWFKLQSQGTVQQSPAVKQHFTNTKKYTFHSPDTHFAQPELGTTLKIETEEYGEAKGYFSEAQLQAEQKLLNYKHYNLSIVLGKFIGYNSNASSENSTGTGQVIGSTLGAGIGSLFPGGTAIGGTIGGLIGGIIGADSKSFAKTIYQKATSLHEAEKILLLLKSLGKYQNYQYQYQAVAHYNNYKPSAVGNKLRSIVNSGYLQEGKQTINSLFFNNSFRESSVFLELNEKVANPSIQDTSRFNLNGEITNVPIYGDVINNTYTVLFQTGYINKITYITPAGLFADFQEDLTQCTDCDMTFEICASAYYIEGTGVLVEYKEFCSGNIIGYKTTSTCNCKSEEHVSNVSSYYASIKRNLPNPYNNLFSIPYIEIDSCPTKLTESKNYFNGDTFITPFALKRKHSFFNATAFQLPIDADIFYSDLGNVAYPMYYFNTKKVYDDVAINFNNKLLTDIMNSSSIPIQNLLSWLTGIFGVNKYVEMAESTSTFFTAMLDSYNWLKPPPYNLDCTEKNVTSGFSFNPVSGVMYLYYYGIPQFYCESDVNTHYRYASNNKEKDFYPNQSNLDYWLQEKNVPIQEDNFYLYNKTYSKQNKEGFHYINDINFKPEKECKVERPNRIIYSLPASEIDDSDYRDNFLINKALDYHDFSLTNGKAIAIDAIESDKMLVRFENNTQVFYAYNTLQTDQQTIIVGNGGIFKNKPQEFSKTTLGYMGSQNKAILNTEFGHVFVDAKRGSVFLLGLNANGIDELSNKMMSNFFKENLSFNLLEYFPNVNIDQQYNHLGIHLGYDKRYKRFFLTKLDYSPKSNTITVKENRFYEGELEVFLTDETYFNNLSWTVSYNFLTKSWVSFHSYTPDFYISKIDNFITNTGKTLWVHNKTNKSYQVYGGKLKSFEIEMIDKYSVKYKQLQHVEYIAEVIRYSLGKNKVFLNELPFNEAVVYNNLQSTGLLKMSLMDENNLFVNKSYPKANADNLEILSIKKGNTYRINDVHNNVTTQNFAIWLYNKNNIDKVLNTNSFSYIAHNYLFDPIVGEINYVILRNTNNSLYKIIFKGLIFNENGGVR